MRSTLPFIFFLLSFSISYSQKIELELKNFQIEIPGRSFFISKVLDSRSDTGKIGWSVINKETKGKYYTFKGGAIHSLSNFLHQNLSSDTTQTALVLNLVSLYVKEKGKIMRSGEAFAKVQVLREKNGLYGKLYETTAFTESVSEVGKDIYSSHERRIRIVLTECLKKFTESKWKDKVPDYVSEKEILEEARILDTGTAKILDTTGLFKAIKKEEIINLKLSQIEYRKGIIPRFKLENKKYHQLWAFKSQFKQTNDLQVQKLFTEYKGKFRLTFLALGIGLAFTAISFSGDASDEVGPNLSLLIPGATFALCSIPIYIKTNKLARKTVERYNSIIQNK